jgi:hypothetical protein
MMIGGRVVLDPGGSRLLFDALPPMIHISGGASQGEPLRWILEQLIRERAEGLPGAGAASAQLAHLMFVHILRAHLQRQGAADPGWLRLASDRRLVPAAGRTGLPPALQHWLDIGTWIDHQLSRSSRFRDSHRVDWGFWCGLHTNPPL